MPTPSRLPSPASPGFSPRAAARPNARPSVNARPPAKATEAPAWAPLPTMNPRTQRAAARAEREKLMVLASIGSIVLLGIVVLGIVITDSVRSSRAESEMMGTLTTMHQQQQNFRAINQRFARWPELARRGARMPAGQRVIASNADASHWFMSIANEDAGVICDRTGELLDESGFEHRSICRSATP